MCGINVIISEKPVSATVIESMQYTTQFRGPDNSAVKNFSTDSWHAAVGVNRLMVVDKDPNANQPLTSECGNYILAYNGEVYNYQDLKNELLKRGYTFYTHSDTEVVLNWLKENGQAGLNQLKGMFALVFFDLTSGTMFWARDRQGIKPLFVYASSDQIVISSAVEGIKATQVSLSLNTNAIEEYLSFRHVLGKNSFYKEIEAVAPGSVNKIDNSLTITSKAISKTEHIRGTLREVLIDSVAVTYQAAMQPGLMLSGGVDSTLLLALLNREFGVYGVPVYTLHTGEDDPWARKASDLFSASQFEIKIESTDFERIDEFLEKTDQPIADHGAMANWLVAEKARQNTNVLLSGAGADEYFGGYNRHMAYKKYLSNQKVLLFLKQILQSTESLSLLPLRHQKALLALNKNPATTFENFLINYGINKYVNKSKLSSKNIYPEDHFSNAIRLDQENFLINDVLAITDNAGMQHGLEIRVPFLYDDILNYCSLQTNKDRYTNVGKSELKVLLTSYGGGQFTRRNKTGFGLPLAGWFRNKRSFHHWHFLNRDNEIYEYLDKELIKKFVLDHQEGRRDNNMQLWSILVLENWLRRS